jgi:hypothetical protein
LEKSSRNACVRKMSPSTSIVKCTFVVMPGFEEFMIFFLLLWQDLEFTCQVWPIKMGCHCKFLPFSVSLLVF